MAVSGIRKISSSTLLALGAVSIVVFALFFFGGGEQDDKGNMVYNFTDILLYWTYALFGTTVLATLYFAFKGFVASFARDSKAAIISVSGVLAFVAILVISYLVGSSEPIAGMNADAQQFNTASWLKLTDMWLYSTYVLFVLSVLAALWGAISSSLLKR